MHFGLFYYCQFSFWLGLDLVNGAKGLNEVCLRTDQ